MHRWLKKGKKMLTTSVRSPRTVKFSIWAIAHVALPSIQEIFLHLKQLLLGFTRDLGIKRKRNSFTSASCFTIRANKLYRAYQMAKLRWNSANLCELCIVRVFSTQRSFFFHLFLSQLSMSMIAEWVSNKSTASGGPSKSNRHFYGAPIIEAMTKHMSKGTL